MESTKADFFNAIKQGNLALVQHSLDQNDGLKNEQDDNGSSAILTALYYGQPAIAVLLLERGVSLNLFEASAAGQVERVRELLQDDPDGANTFAPDGFQPLGLAAFFGRTSVARVLLEHGADPNTPSQNGLRVQPINSAVAGQHLELTRLLLDNGADVNARQGEDFTPLHSAAQNGQLDMIELLFSRGANPKASTTSGKTPYDMAVEAHRLEAAERLKVL